jgi:hypothetical protein
MKAVICPFCGVVSDVPHKTQEGCIKALEAEISRTRQVLESVTEPLRPPTVAGEEDPPALSGPSRALPRVP